MLIFWICAPVILLVCLVTGYIIGVKTAYRW
jgi:hypothetical protein